MPSETRKHLDGLSIIAHEDAFHVRKILIRGNIFLARDRDMEPPSVLM
jgi:hypothetical protein